MVVIWDRVARSLIYWTHLEDNILNHKPEFQHLIKKKTLENILYTGNVGMSESKILAK